MPAPTRVYFDVENTLQVPFISGIQRVVRELSRRLIGNIDSQFEFIPVVYCAQCKGWRKLSDGETERLKKLSLGDSIVDQDIPAYRKLATKLLGKKAKVKVRSLFKRITHPVWHKNLLLPNFEAGSIFLDLDASWHNELKRSSLLPALKEDGVYVVAFHYDIIPILFPDFTHENTISIFKEHLHAHLRFSNLFICISKNTEKDLLNYARMDCSQLNLKTATLRLGSDINASPIARDSAWPLPEKNLKYILCVGTLEPRKNHKLVLDAFDILAIEDPVINLVIVGREGWHAQEIVDRIRSHDLFNSRLFWLTGIENYVLNELYRKARLVVVPSFYEGFGLPVTESLQNGCVTLASNAGSLPEAGNKFCEYFSPDNLAEFIEKLQFYFNDEAGHRNRRRSLMQYIPDTWDSASKMLVDILKDFDN